ncbi:hypothetical protein EDB85DRAFT_1930269 [Lactarius pseudohatsudake]|nr:hypothetical protein EDB85DRAFT_1930269 [Lactarius pseudohatsudake]
MYRASLAGELNIAAVVRRRNSVLHEWLILGVTDGAAVTAAVSYLAVFLRVPASDLVANFNYFKNVTPNALTSTGCATRLLCGRACFY